MKDKEEKEDILNFKDFLAHEERKLPKIKNDFVSFVYEIGKDYYDDSESWENVDIGSYLEALAAWVDDMEGFYIYRGLPVPENPNWQLIADMLDVSSKIDVRGVQKKRDIKTKKDFVSFVNELSASYYDDPESWHHKDVGAYLKALAAWINDMEGYYQNQEMPVPENQNWQLMSRMLSAARFYE